MLTQQAKATHNIVKPLGTRHQVIIYTLEAKVSHKISETQKAKRVRPWEQKEKKIGYQEKEYLTSLGRHELV